MEKKKTVSFALTQEELYVLLMHLKFQGMLGLDLEQLSQLNEADLKLVVGVAERGLVARNYMTIENDQLKVADLIYAVVATCAAPNTTLMLRRNDAGKLQENYYFHTLRKMVVYHAEPILGIHQFIALEDLDAMTRSVVSLLELGEVNPPCGWEGAVKEETIAAAREAGISNGENAAADILKAANLDESTAFAFAKSLANPAVSLALVHLYDQQADDRKGEIEGFSLLKGQSNDLWILLPGQGEVSDGMVQFKSVSDLDMIKKIQGMINKG